MNCRLDGEATFVYTAFVIDVFANRLVGWRTARSMTTGLVLDALEQALYARVDRDGLIHHSDRGTQYLSICYTERLREAGIDGSVGGTGNSYDNALAGSLIGLYAGRGGSPRQLPYCHWLAGNPVNCI